MDVIHSDCALPSIQTSHEVHDNIHPTFRMD